MRLQRVIALMSAMFYISTVGAAAVELPAAEEAAVQTAAAAQLTEGETQAVQDAAAVEMAAEEEQPAAEPAVTAPVARALRVSPSKHHVKVNGQAVNPQVYNINGYNYFKLRDVAYLLRNTGSSFAVNWNSELNAIDLLPGEQYTVVGGELTVASTTTLRVQESTAKVLLDGNGISIQGYMINGNNYYKIADVSSAIGFTAAFESATSTVQITTPSPAPEDPEDPEDTAPETPDEPEEPEEPDTPAETFTTGVYRVKVDTSLSVRSGPGLDQPIIGRLSNGDEIIVDQITNGWAHILDEDGSRSQYCSADYLTRVRDYMGEDDEINQPVEQPFQPGVYRVKVDTSLSVRAGAGTSYPIIGKLSNGDEIVIDSAEDGWGHLMKTGSGTDRYCSMDYLVYVRAYDKEDGTPNDPVEPPRTSHLDGVKTVIIAPGHGGSDVGATSPDQSLDEKHINLSVAKYLQSYLEADGYKVIMVRDTLEEGSSLSLRGQVMEQYASSADLFFSIHHNAANTTARGAEILAQIADRNGGPTKLLAEALLDEYAELGVPIRSVVFKEGSNGDYYYTNRAAAALFIPALTSEFCFIDNAEDQKFIDSEADLQAEARAQYNAIVYYFTQVEY